MLLAMVVGLVFKNQKTFISLLIYFFQYQNVGSRCILSKSLFHLCIILEFQKVLSLGIRVTECRYIFTRKFSYNYYMSLHSNKCAMIDTRMNLDKFFYNKKIHRININLSYFLLLKGLFGINIFLSSYMVKKYFCAYAS